MARLSREQRKHREQRKELIQTYLSQHPDATLKQIGTFLGVSKQRAHVLLKLLGLPTRKQSWSKFPTERQMEILRYTASAYTNKQIAAAFGVSEWTINGQNRIIFAKLKANTRAEAVALAEEQGLVWLDSLEPTKTASK